MLLRYVWRKWRTLRDKFRKCKKVHNCNPNAPVPLLVWTYCWLGLENYDHSVFVRSSRLFGSSCLSSTSTIEKRFRLGVQLPLWIPITSLWLLLMLSSSKQHFHFFSIPIDSNFHSTRTPDQFRSHTNIGPGRSTWARSNTLPICHFPWQRSQCWNWI